MEKHLELRDPKSCLNKAGPTEFVFVLREKDPLFEQTVRHWAAMAVGIHEQKKIDEALDTAATVAKRKAEKPTDFMPPSVRAPVALGPGQY